MGGGRCCGCAKRWDPAMTPAEITPIDEGLLDALLAADAAMAADGGPKGLRNRPGWTTAFACWT